MSEHAVDPGDEGRHEPGPEPLWGESWYFDFFDLEATIGGWVRIGLYPNVDAVWYHAILVEPGGPTVSVAEYDVALPAPPGLEIRAEGLWADHVRETALEHWTLGNEAFGLAVDDPASLYAAVPLGDRVPLGLDLEWETDGSPYHYVYTTRYEIPCVVHGEIALGDRRVELDGFGQRDHSWGVRDWWQFGWCWTSGRLEDGTRFHGSDIRIPNADVGFGYVQSGGRTEGTNSVHASEDLGAEGLPVTGEVAIGDLHLAIDPLAFAPALLTHDGRVSRFPRAMCRFTADDGRTGLGWTEWNQPEVI